MGGAPASHPVERQGILWGLYARPLRLKYDHPMQRYRSHGAVQRDCGTAGCVVLQPRHEYQGCAVEHHVIWGRESQGAAEHMCTCFGV